MDQHKKITSTPPPTGYRVIRGKHTPTTITVYQAYNSQIASAAVKAQKFVPPFTRARMTWIKPSFLWMAYRSGWAGKPNQERVLAIEIKREGWEWALRNSCLSHYSGDEMVDKESWQNRLKSCPVRIQWDPERDFEFRPLEYRAIQVGLSGEAVDRYVDEWIVGIEDITDRMKMIEKCLEDESVEEAMKLVPEEKVYPLLDELRGIIHASI